MIMKPEIKSKWIEALCSGEYKQGQYFLKVNNHYCCLGVLCDLHSKETGTEWEGNHYLNFQSTLPDSILPWISENGMFNEHHTFITMNDLKRYTFEQIADYIEKTC